MKDFLKKCLNALLAFILRLVSRRLKVRLIMKLLDSAVEKVSAEKTLRFLFDLDNSLYSMEGKAAVAYGKGIHTMSFDTGRVRLDGIPPNMPCPTLSHLASAGVARA